MFDPGKYKDEYREALQRLIQAKIAGREVATPPPESTGAPETDLTSALSASVQAARQRRQRAAALPRRPGRDPPPGLTPEFLRQSLLAGALARA